MARERQEQSHGHFGCGIVEHAWRVANHETCILARFHVDVIDAHAHVGDNTNLAAPRCHNVARHSRVAHRENGLDVRRRAICGQAQIRTEDGLHAGFHDCLQCGHERGVH